MLNIVEGITKKMQRPGYFVGATTPLEKVQAGGFVAAGVGSLNGNPLNNGYVEADPTANKTIYINLTSGNRGDVECGGLAVIGGENYTLETDIVSDTLKTTTVAEAALTITVPDANGLSVLTVVDGTTSGHFIYGSLIKNVGGVITAHMYDHATEIAP